MRKTQSSANVDRMWDTCLVTYSDICQLFCMMILFNVMRSKLSKHIIQQVRNTDKGEVA